ncbi:choline dehydrogenase-like flavoprotein [Catenulispora sp. GP43]|uniref:GMC family oxidoreductase n=1 Tax=Catenulispora sp. GP43 TaxID=3156263 RepID=UPI0035140780
MAARQGFDVVVLGGGTAGAVVAARLSEDPGRRVLLVEAGPDYPAAETPEAVRGSDFLRAATLRQLRWPNIRALLTEAGPERPYLCGRGIGGSSVINGQSAIRGLPDDFDRWDVPGWSWAEVAPVFQRLEDDADFGDQPGHGVGGPVPVSRSPRRNWGTASHALAVAAAGLGHAQYPDINAPGSTGVSPVTWNRRDGMRVSMKDAYIEPARGRPNLCIRPDTLAVRLRFHRDRFVGVDLADADGVTLVRADRAVVCLGAVHSPALLLRSGIGPACDLRSLGVPVVADVPGVGLHLQDHPTVWLRFPAAEEVSSAAQSSPGHCALRFSSHACGAPDNDLQLYVSDPSGSAAGVMAALLDPRSTGRIRLRSADPAAEPEVAFRMLAASADVDRMTAGLREAARILEHPEFKAVMAGPARLATTPVEDALADPDLPRLLRRALVPYHHATGGCRMGSDDAAVLDPDGAVRGVEGVIVADASVMPRTVRAPTHLTTVMVAERLSGLVSA